MSDSQMLTARGGVNPRSIVANADVLKALNHLRENAGTVVATWRSGANWYRKYSDGWIEQGGTTTYPAHPTVQTLNTPFTNPNYCIVCSYRGGVESDDFNAVTGLNIKPYTSSQFKRACWSGSDAVKGYWYACGY